ncbi:MAG TPA: ribosome small subunit-dependent GTPase A [Candidatus Nanopelagicales bacterium]
MLRSTHPLLPFGLDQAVLSALPPQTEPVRIIRHDGQTLLGVGAGGRLPVRASPRLAPTPTVGDWAAVPAQDPRADPAVPAVDAASPLPLLAVLPRRSLLRRLAADEVGDQALAANVDLVLITCGADRPIRAGRVQRVAAQAWDAGATPVLVVTKVGAPGSSAVDGPRLELEHPGMQVMLTSALEDLGMAPLRALLAGRTAVLVGESGAGKSTLTNALLGRAEAATGAVRASDAKGRHTTTARQLHLLPDPGGCLIDTPGVRAVGFAADAAAVDEVFADVAELALACRFTDCGHRTEPGCAVLAALDAGALPAARYDGWLRLQREVASARVRSSPQAQREHERRFARQVRSGRGRSRP